MSPAITHPVAGRRTATIAGTWAFGEHPTAMVESATNDLVLIGTPVGNPLPWPVDPTPPDVEPGGLCFDGRWVYHGDPDRGQIVRASWPRRAGEGVEDLLPRVGADADEGRANFRSATAGVPDLRARALAVDGDHRLYVLDGPSASIAVIDLLDGRLMSSVAVDRSAPVDLASTGRDVLVALASRAHPVAAVDPVAGLLRSVPVPDEARSVLDGLPPAARPTRIAVDPAGGVWLLLRAGTVAWVVQVHGDRAGSSRVMPGARDLEVDGDGSLVIAGPAGHDIRVLDPDGLAESAAPLAGRRYDGRGIARTPEGRVGHWTPRGFQVLRHRRRSYLDPGHADSCAIDAEQPRQVWGRVFIEACVPPGTRLEVGFASADEPPGTHSSTRGHPGSVPPPDEAYATLAEPFPLHRRETGREVPWAPLPRGDRYEVYEAPVMAPPGRFLWLRLHLGGTATTTPRVRTVRVECDSHELLDQLPRLYREDAATASQLRRYLALVDGQLRDLEWRAVQRDRILEPFGAPAEVLPWIASLIGLSLDTRWSERARRTLLAEAICLYRWRGTMRGLRRVLEIYLDAPVSILEAFRVKGYGGSFVGGAGTTASATSAVVGRSFRVGGSPDSSADAFATHAHRFSVLVSRELCGDERAVLLDLLELHRPAHTLVELCDTSRGMRIGMSLHIALSTIVGRDAGYVPAVVGSADVGAGTVLGHGHAGVRPGVTVLDDSTVVDP